jgi:hypothetical protein
MKNVYILLLVLLLPACKKGYLDVNQSNPNLTDKPPINGLLAATTYASGKNVFYTGYIASYYVQQLASPNVGSGSDIYDDVDRSSTWRTLYFAVEDLRQMQALATEKNAYEHIGVAKVLEALNISMLIDFFGNVPYTEAWNKNIFKPEYDDAQHLYDTCLTLLDGGIAAFNLSNPLIKLDAANDLIHGANKDAWIATAYALKARLLNRKSKQADYNPQAILEALSHAYTSNAGDAQLTRFENQSPWDSIAIRNASANLDGWLSATFINALNGTTYGVFDPRLPHITDTTKYGDYRGTVNGAGRVGSGTDTGQCYLSLKGFYSGSAAPLLLITYAEMKFIEAEAYFSTDKAKSYQAYLDGIAANMDKLGVSVPEKNAYLANPAVGPGVAAYTKALLFKEKYVATFLQPETWTDARRFDYQYKDFALPQNALLNTFIRRAGYPASETSSNGENVPVVNSLADKLWWDQ